MSKKATINAITKFIFLEDKLEKADLMIVAGSRSTVVPEKAARIYKKGLVSKIIFTGGYNENINVYESEFMKKIAEEYGVSVKNTILEKKSKNTKENATQSLKIVKKYKLNHSKIILVGLAYHTRRLKMTFSKFFPDSEILVTSPKGTLVSRRNWWKNSFGREKVLSELAKIGKYYLKGDLEIFK